MVISHHLRPQHSSRHLFSGYQPPMPLGLPWRVQGQIVFAYHTKIGYLVLTRFVRGQGNNLWQQLSTEASAIIDSTCEIKSTFCLDLEGTCRCCIRRGGSCVSVSNGVGRCGRGGSISGGDDCVANGVGSGDGGGICMWFKTFAGGGSTSIMLFAFKPCKSQMAAVPGNVRSGSSCVAKTSPSIVKRRKRDTQTSLIAIAHITMT